MTNSTKRVWLNALQMPLACFILTKVTDRRRPVCAERQPSVHRRLGRLVPESTLLTSHINKNKAYEE